MRKEEIVRGGEYVLKTHTHGHVKAVAQDVPYALGPRDYYVPMKLIYPNRPDTERVRRIKVSHIDREWTDHDQELLEDWLEDRKAEAVLESRFAAIGITVDATLHKGEEPEIAITMKGYKVMELIDILEEHDKRTNYS